MSKILNLTGQRYGRLVVLHKGPKKENRTTSYWLCQCDCGNTKNIRTDHLTRGSSLSCGCLRDEEIRKVCQTHGLSNSSEFQTWSNIKKRCYNKTANNYERYGGRGITVSDDWLKSFENFYRDMGPKPGPEYSIERGDNSKGYSKENCYWATDTEQQNNKRNNVFITYEGKTQTKAQWCYELCITYKILTRGLKNGKDLRTIAYPAFEMVTLNPSDDGPEETMSVCDWCDFFRLDKKVVYQRIHQGEKLEDIIKE